MLLIKIGLFVFLLFKLFDAWAEYQGRQDKKKFYDNQPRVKRK